MTDTPSSQIKQLQTLLEKQLNKKINIVEQQAKYLTTPGENYGSVMLALSLKIEDENRITEDLNLVAKLLPPNEVLCELFRVQITFRKELAIYTKTVPALEEIEDEYNIKTRASTLFAKCYGGRLNLKTDEDLVDSDAVLLFENLKILGYGNGDRLEGFDYKTAELVLENLARFHATPIALRILKPKDYKKNIADILVVKQPDLGLNPDKIEIYLEKLKKIVFENQNFVPEFNKLADDLRKKFRTNFYGAQNENKPFVSISHSDFWLNNMMILWDNSGNPINLKMVDFQTPILQSVTADLLFFMFSSIRPSDLYDNVDKLIRIYHDSFISCLKEFHVNLEDFSWENFQLEIKNKALDGLSQIIMMYKYILLPRGIIHDMSNFGEDDIFALSPLSDDCKDRMARTFNIFVSKGWI